MKFLFLIPSILSASMLTCDMQYNKINFDSQRMNHMIDTESDDVLLQQTYKQLSAVAQYDQSCCTTLECRKDTAAAIHELNDIIYILKNARATK